MDLKRNEELRVLEEEKEAERAEREAEKQRQRDELEKKQEEERKLLEETLMQELQAESKFLEYEQPIDPEELARE